MSSEAPIYGRRRGERVLIRIPVTVRVHGAAETSMEDTETLVVSQYGALLRFSQAPPLGTVVEIKNRFSDQVEKFRVAWVGESMQDGHYDVGVEILNPRGDFWGIQFPAKERTRA